MFLHFIYCCLVLKSSETRTCGLGSKNFCNPGQLMLSYKQYVYYKLKNYYYLNFILKNISNVRDINSMK